MNKITRDFIEQLGNLTISPQIIIDLKLVNYMKGVGHRFSKLKKDADLVARKWQQEVDLWLRENNLTEKNYLEQIDRNKAIQLLSPRLNGAWKANQRDSGSDDRQNYHSSSSQEVESPDSQRANQRSASINHISNHHHSFGRKSSSPLQLENPVTRNLNRAEFNANLSIDPKEVMPSNKVQESPVKPDDRFCVSLKEKMFKAVKRKEPILEENLGRLLCICKDVLKLPIQSYPEFVRDYLESLKYPGKIIKVNSDSGDCRKSLNGKTEKNMDFTHVPDTRHKSHNNPSTSQQGARESSRNCSDSKHDRRKKYMESTQSAVKAKELKEEQPLSQDSNNLPSSRSYPGSNHDRKRKCTESTQSVVNSKELKLEQQPTQDIKNLPSTSQQGGTESSRTCPVSKHDSKRKRMESSQSVVKAKELKEEQQLSQDSKLKHMSRTEYVVKGKESKEEQQPAQGRTLKCKETAQSVAKAYEFKDEYQPAQESKLKLDSKRVCAMALEARNCDKNHIKKKDSPDQSAMLAITSSKKERSSLYHGGRKSEVLKLKDLCIRNLHKVIKQNSDPTKYINKNVEFEILEPVLVLISPDKLQKLEDEMEYLKADTDGVWHLCCDRTFKSQVHLKKKNENWRTFYQRCCMESEEKLRNITASISASASKAKPDRQIKFTTVDGPPTKRQKTDSAMVVKNNANNSAIKLLPNSCHPSNSRSDAPVPAKGISNHIKSSHRIIKKDAPLMHKAKKTLGQLHRIHRN
ncbi:hypothetical protein AVEN_93743-1 [Araneus ventricosus]|uniref:Elongin-A n=1 Tax=Araneus ventricosus TaxID=182803 RepID=A0A4Y2J886_ARAVE|nr:hypothetical protein AVEN_93743-1 [Araneus ventricosus]